jgi:predicted exporter
MLAMLAVFAVRVMPQLKIETDILALLPTDNSTVGTTAAVAKFSQALAGKLILLVGAPELEPAKSAARVFVANLRNSSAFSQVTLEKGGLTTAMLDLYQAHRAYLLSTQDFNLLNTGKADQLQRDALRAAYTPAGLMRPVSFADDPLGLASDYLLQQVPSMGAAQLDGTVLVLPGQEQSHVLITAELNGSPFASQVEEDALAAIEAARVAAVKAIAPAKLDFVMSGTLQHANAARERATTELNVFGSIETLSVMALLITVFSALRPLALGALTMALAFVAGLCATHFAFGTVHVLALVFGSSLIGGVIDYSIHFFADRFRGDPNWTPAAAVEHVGGAILLGLTTTLLGYVVLLAVPFPGLRQIALFCVAGLAVGCVTVLCAYPVWYRVPKKTAAWGPRIGERLTHIFTHWQWTPSRIAITSVLLLAALLGLIKVNLQDDVRALQSSPPLLIAAEQRVAGLLKSGIESRYFLVQANTEQALLESETQLAQSLDRLKAQDLLNNYTALTHSLPSLKQQQANHEVLNTQVLNVNGALPQLLQQLGFGGSNAAARVAAFATGSTPLTPMEWLTSAASRPYRDLWLGNLNGRYSSIVSLAGVKDVAALRNVAANVPNARLIDQVNAVSQVLRSYRRAMSWLLCVVYAIAWFILSFKFGWREAPMLLVPSALASAVTLGVFGWLGVPVNLFTLLALWLVLGLGVDYGIFLRHGHTALPTAVLSVTLSATTTLLAFGLLAFSATPFIRSIGLTLLCAISLSWLFAVVSCLTFARSADVGPRTEG